MMLGDTFFEPSEDLWPAVPLFLLVLFVLDVLVIRPRWRRVCRWPASRRWLVAGGLIGVMVLLMWLCPGVSSRAGWWYPAWVIVLFWLIAARDLSDWVAALGRRSLTYGVRLGCGVGMALSLLALARSTGPSDTSLLAWSLVGLAILTCVWSRRSYRGSDLAPGGHRRLPLVLRFSAIAVLAVLLLNPISRSTRVRYDRACLPILIDDSASMEIRDVVVGQGNEPASRADALNRSLAARKYEFDRMGRDLDVLKYGFSERLVAVGGLRCRPEGRYTALGDAVQQAYESLLQDSRPVAGVLVFTDGASNLSEVSEPAAAAASLAAGRVPLWIVGVGSEVPSGQTRTILARNLLMPRRVAAMNEVAITAEFAFVGLQGEPVRLELLFDDEIVDRQRVVCTRLRETRQVQFRFAPRVGGLHKVTVQARPERFMPEGPVPSISQFLHVTDEVIRVLYLEGKPRYEGTFVVRALSTSDQIRLQKAVLAQPRDDRLRSVPGGPAGQWQWYHVIILGDMAPGQLTDYHMGLLRHHVGEDGCGLAVLGSRGFLSTGSLKGTPLEDVLPMSTSAGWIDQPVKILPTGAGLTHPILQIDPASSDQATSWAQLPAMRGACRFESPKPAAHVLAKTQLETPAIVAHTFGAGRVVALAFDSTWQWCMQMDQGTEYHRRFWRQVVLWLANRRPAVWIAADRPRYQLPLLRSGRQRVEIRVGVDSPISGQSVGEIELEARLLMPGGDSAALPLTKTDDHYQATAEPKVEGIHRLELVARSGGREIGQATGQFIVESPDVEMVQKVADFELLREMAARTHPAGGKFATLDDMDEILGEIGTHDYRRRHEETISHQLTHDARWHLWTLFCGLILAEWIVRKRRGMV
ncbi:MAG: hypothetical protein JXQ73_08465 [Phycisphaerae bacterium]|nr:hypothetical protein [Phycisphaerae bacterium]